jgi:hypothetical protein
VGKKSRVDDERPAKRKKSRGKSGGQTWLIGLLLGLVLFAVVGAVVWVFSLRKSDKEREAAENTPKKVLLRYAPDSPIGFYTARMAQLLADPHYKQIRGKHQANFEWQPIITVPKEKIERYTAFSSRKGSTTILSLTEPMTEADVRQKNTGTGIANSWSEEKFGKQTLHVHTSDFKIFTEGGRGDGGRDPTCFFMPDSKTIVFGTAEDLRPVMERGGRPADLSPEFAAIYETIDFEKPLVTGGASSEGRGTVFDDKPCAIDLKLHLEKNVIVGKVVHTEFGPEIVTTSTYLCKDEASAQYVKTALEANTERRLKPLGPDARELFKNQTFTLNGNMLTVRNGQRVTDILAWIEKNQPKIIGD